MAKKSKKVSQVETPIITDNNEFSRLIKIILIVTGIFVVFYGVTILVTKNTDQKTTTSTPKTDQKAEIQYENIMIGSMLNYKGTYYVLIEQDEDNRLAEYNSLIENIKTSDDTPTIYKANLTDSFNKQYLGKEENYYVSDINEFRVKETTLIKITDGKIEGAYDNYNAIKNKLKELS